MEAESQNQPLPLKPLRLNFNFIELLYIQMNLLGNYIPCWLKFYPGSGSRCGLELHVIQFQGFKVEKTKLHHTNDMAIKEIKSYLPKPMVKRKKRPDQLIAKLRNCFLQYALNVAKEMNQWFGELEQSSKSPSCSCNLDNSC